MATVEDWSNAMSPASFGNIEQRRGSCREGLESVETQMGIWVAVWEGWVLVMLMVEAGEGEAVRV